MTDKTTAQILSEAADVIDRNGWHQGELYDAEAAAAGKDPKDCPVCLMGAIHVAGYGLPTWTGAPGGDEHERLMRCTDRAVIAAVDHLIDLYAGTDMEPVLPDWNDAPSRTRDQVTAFLRAAAAKARG